MVRSSLVCTATLCLALPLAAQTTFQAPSQASPTAPAPTAPAHDATALTVDRIFKTGELRSAILPETHWLRDGVSFIDVRQGAGGGDIVRVDAVTGKATVLVSATALAANGKQIDIEDMILSGDESKALLFHSSERVWRQNTKGQYAVVDFATKKVTPISATTTAKMFAKFSPDARSVAYVRDNNLYVWDLAAGTERQLTTDGNANIINGTTDWVYEEEFDLRDAFRWSPDGTRIAFWRFDQSAEPVMTMENLTDSLYPTFVQYKYPKAGQPNATVKIGVVSLANGETRWINTGPESSDYLPRMGWLGRDSLWVERMPRKQNRADLLAASATTGMSRVIFSDTDSAYVDVVDPMWIHDGKQFLWSSDRSGWRQVYLYNRGGSLVRQITKDGSDVLEISGVDEKRGIVYVKAAAPNPTQRQIYRYTLDGSSAVQLTRSEGSQDMSLAPGGKYAAITHSSLNVPPVMTLYELPTNASTGMRAVRLMGDNGVLKQRIDSLNLAAATFLRVPSADKSVMLDAYRMVPANFDSTKKYPVLMYTYGGPAAAQVTDSWAGSRYFFHQMLTQHGYVVIVADNRGAAWRGTHFRKMTQHKLGIAESDDQIAVAKWIGQQTWGDSARVGLWGWSYGGYNTAMSAFRGGSIFKMAISVAPVSDWRYYDSIYTERFMWTPADNAQGYQAASALGYVDGLKAKYLLVFGTGDDNVHPQNSVVLAQKLQLARKPFVTMFFPNKTHSISGPGGTLPVYDLIERFVRENL
jgi:dipeptidyl-peptidase 4